MERTLDNDNENSLKRKMRVLCDVCESAEASLICCADEAALCWQCDIKVHGANKLANKHQRVSLIRHEASNPLCDICQDKRGYFFCVEDRALMCRECDLCIHSNSRMSSDHQRFLVTGARVGLNALETPEAHQSASTAPNLCSSLNTASITNSRTPISWTSSLSLSQHSRAKPNAKEISETATIDHHVRIKPGHLTRKSTISEFLTETVPGWKVDDLLSLTDFSVDYPTTGNVLNKGDIPTIEDFDWMINPCFEDEISIDNFHEVPKMPSPPTMSGLSSSKRVEYGKKSYLHERDYPYEPNVLIVPDLGIRSSTKSPHRKQSRIHMEE